jgi:hypothetical protein
MLHFLKLIILINLKLRKTMKNALRLLTLSTIVLLTGCNNTETSTENNTLPSSYQYKTINNRGTVVETLLDGNTIEIYSDSAVSINPQARHIGIVVNVSGKVSPTMQIEDTYIGKNIVAVVYDKQGNELAVSSEVEVNDVPVMVLEITL